MWPIALSDSRRAIDGAVEAAPARMRAVIEALQALRGIALISAVTIVSEVGELSRFTETAAADGLQRRRRERAFQRRADPARGNYQNGNAHLRRVVDRSRVGLSAPPGGGRRAAQAPGAAQSTR